MRVEKVNKGRQKQLGVKGISLIVLVISIIIMIVLATTMVLSITNSGILEQANTAVSDSNVSNAQEELQTKYVEWLSASNTSNAKMSKEDAQSLIDVSKYNLQGKYAVRVTPAGVPYLQAKVEPSVNWETAEYSHANMTYAGLSTGYGYNNPIIPKGFKPLETADASWDYLDFNDGLVIQDQNGNQFVWVPVSDINLFDKISSELPYTMELEGKIVESVFDEEIPQFVAMRTSVEEYAGFYIARFEVGDATATANNYTGRTLDTVNAHAWAIKSSQIPYNYIDCDQSKTMANGMYDSNEYGAKSTLTFGTQWVYTIQWLKNFDENIDLKNNTWGNNRSNTSVLTNQTVYGATYIIPTLPKHLNALHRALNTFSVIETNSNKRSDVVTLLTTGASQEYMKKNIYDMGGNLAEFVVTYSTNDILDYGVCVAGGSCYFTNNEYDVYYKNFYVNYSSKDSCSGFRPTMYIL